MLSDLRYSFRSLLKTPGISLVIILSLALGIGANATTLCWLQGLLNNPLPGVRAPEELVVIVSNQGGGNASLPDLRDFEGLQDVFEGVVATQLSPVFLKEERRSEWAYAQVATSNYFQVLGARMLHGRAFLPEEDRKPGGNPVVILGEAFWRRSFRADSAVIGRTLQINRHSFTVIGVVAEPFGGSMSGLKFDLWAPISMCREVLNMSGLEFRSARMWHNLARLKQGVSLEQAQAALKARNAQLSAEYPQTNRLAEHRVVSLSDCPWGAQSILLPVLRMLLCVSLLVWLLVVANVTNLLLSRAVQRRKEIAIRLATGASRFQLIRLLLAESLVLAVLGGGFGLLLATWMVDLLRLFLPTTDLPTGALHYMLDPVTVGITVLFTLVTGLLMGLLPALQASNPNLSDALKDGGRGGSSGVEHQRLRRALVVCEVALSVTLLISAALCIKGFREARNTDLGLDPKGVVIAELHIGMHGYNEVDGKRFYASLQRRLSEIPGVESAALSSWFPLGFGGCKGADARPEGYEPKAGEDSTCEVARVSPGYFDALRVGLLAGRDFRESDDENAMPVAIVNEAFARHFWPGQDPIGRTFRSGGRLRTIVGLARQGKYYRLNEPARRFFYLPYAQGVSDLDLGLCVRVAGDPLSYAQAIGKAVKAVDPEVELRGLMPMRDYTMAALFADTIAAGMLSMMGAVALALATMGIHAVMSYSVSQRTREFGIRMALGAQKDSVLRLVLWQCLQLVLLGLGLGLVLTALGTGLLSRFLYGVSPFDPFIYALAPLLLGAVALLACLFPALRATRVDPIQALRAE